MPVAEEKQRAREQWSEDPCGAVYGREQEFGTREFFDAVERHRYTEYAPWMPAVMGFNDFAGARLLEVGCGMGTDLYSSRGAAQRSPESISLRGRLRFRDSTWRSMESAAILRLATARTCRLPMKVSMSFIRTACCITRPTRPAPCAKSIASCARAARRG